ATPNTNSINARYRIFTLPPYILSYPTKTQPAALPQATRPLQADPLAPRCDEHKRRAAGHRAQNRRRVGKCPLPCSACAATIPGTSGAGSQPEPPVASSLPTWFGLIRTPDNLLGKDPTTPETAGASPPSRRQPAQAARN